MAIGLDEEQNATVDGFGCLKARREGGGFEGCASEETTNPELVSQTAVSTKMQVRRLTPRECERLQGFPDDYTKINDKTPDNARYKALGNSMAVPVMAWIGKRILMFRDPNE